ncbi:MAG: glycosyltransferase [Actinobacteria bacterium]|nr:glycosyltransferase [Actinomycetota bacterium]
MSVVIPCYNYGHYLPVAVESVASQDGVDVDVLIIDDCSTDDSFAVAQSLAARNPRVRAIRNEENSRLIATANKGLSLVTGTYALLISADDALAPGALGRATSLMEANPDVGLTYGHVDYFTTDDVPNEIPAPSSHWVIWNGEDWASRVFASGRGPIASPEAVVRTSVMREAGEYDPAFPHTSDLHMWLRLAARSSIGFVGGTTQAYYRMHGANMSVTQFGLDSDRRPLRDLRFRMDAFESTAPLFPEGSRYMTSARRGVAADALDLARVALDRGPEAREYVDEIVAYAAALNPLFRFTPRGAAFTARKLTGSAFARTGMTALLERLSVRDTIIRDQREADTGTRR